MPLLPLGSARQIVYHHHTDNRRHDVPWLMFCQAHQRGLIYNFEEVRIVRSSLFKSKEHRRNYDTRTNLQGLRVNLLRKNFCRSPESSMRPFSQAERVRKGREGRYNTTTSYWRPLTSRLIDHMALDDWLTKKE